MPILFIRLQKGQITMIVDILEVFFTIIIIVALFVIASVVVVSVFKDDR